MAHQNQLGQAGASVYKRLVKRIDFEMLKNDKIDKIICTGPQKYDLATRIKYANIDENKIVCFDDLFDAEKEIKKSSGNIYAILNFDYLDFFNEIMKEEE